MKGRECVNMSLSHWLGRYRTERLTERKQQGIYKLIIGLVERFEVYQRQICKRKDYVMNIGTMTAEDLRSLENTSPTNTSMRSSTRNFMTATAGAYPKRRGAATT